MDKKITADFKQSFPPKWIMFAWGHGNYTTLSMHIQTNLDLPCDYHTKDSDPSTISRDVKSLRTLPKWSVSARIEQAKHREPLHDPYTGNYTNDQNFHQPHWKSSQIKLCQTQTNKIQHNTTTSLMQHADIKDNYPLWRSQATILKNILKILPRTKRYTQDAILKVSQCSQCPQVQNANQLTE